MPAAAAIAVVAVGAYQANKQQQQANRAMSAQEAAANKDLAFRQEMYDKWVNEYETPLLKPMIKEIGRASCRERVLRNV
jgi:hypothetical protein